MQIAEFNAKAAVKTAEGQAQSKTVNATADANVLITVGNAEAGKTKAIGTAEADVIKLKIASMDSGNYAGIEIAKALSGSGFKLVPDVMVAGNGSEGGGSGGGGGLVSVLLANLIRDGLKKSTATDSSPAGPVA